MPKDTSRAEFVDSVIDVRYAETDQMGVVYYANYLVWFEVGRGAWCRARGFQYGVLETQHNRMSLVAEATCRYKAPARYDDVILIRMASGGSNDKVIRFQYEIRSQSSGQLLATGATVHVATDCSLCPAQLPGHIAKLFLR
jgi:acyl-CoA thioester hydrolase